MLSSPFWFVVCIYLCFLVPNCLMCYISYWFMFMLVSFVIVLILRLYHLVAFDIVILCLPFVLLCPVMFNFVLFCFQLVFVYDSRLFSLFPFHLVSFLFCSVPLRVLLFAELSLWSCYYALDMLCFVWVALVGSFIMLFICYVAVLIMFVYMSQDIMLDL